MSWIRMGSWLTKDSNGAEGQMPPRGGAGYD